MKILIADDEQHIRRSLQKILQGFGYEEIVEAEDGKDALEKLLLYRPDLIIADIKMPIMDGIELLKKLRESNDSVPFIILSGYDYFDYAQKAIKLGALSYLLKPVNENELISCINTVKETLDLNTKQMKNNNLLKIKSRQHDQLLKRHFFTEIINSVITDKPYILEKMDELGIDILWGGFIAIIVSIDNYFSQIDFPSIQDKNLQKFSIANIFTEYFNHEDFLVFPFNIQDGEGFILNFNPENPSLESGKLKELCIDAYTALFDTMNFSVSVGIGCIVTGIENVPESFMSARKALAKKIMKSGERIYLSEKDSAPHSAPLVSFQIEQDLLHFLEKGDTLSANLVIEDLYNRYLNASNIDIDGLKRLNYQLVILLYKILNRFKVDAEDILGDELSLYTCVNNLSDVNSILNFFKEKIDLCMGSISSNKERSSRKLLYKAKEYIEDNYNKQISLESVAEYIHLNPEYFSREFKKEFGENFIDYLTRFRITKAKELLMKGDKKAIEVSQLVGFNNFKYFAKLFKKTSGFTPREFKNSQ